MHEKIGIVALLFTGLFIIASFTSFDSKHTKKIQASARERKIQQEVFGQIVFFRDYVKNSLFFEVNKEKVNGKSVRQTFLKSRLLFKKFEWAAEYFSADLAKRLNGPPVKEIENADLLDPSLARAVDPMGLQVIEQCIYPEYDTARKKELISQVGHLITNTEYLISYFADQQLADWRILDAVKLEVFRINALGIVDRKSVV